MIAALLVGFWTAVLAVAVAIAVFAHIYLPRYAGENASMLEGMADSFAVLLLFAPFPFFRQRPRFSVALDASMHPQLFERIELQVRRSGEIMPSEIHVMISFNASVQRLGYFGTSRKWCLFLGLPLIQAVTVAELDAIVAHEIGHIRGREGRLAAWLNWAMITTRYAAIGVPEREISPLNPFHWYSRFVERAAEKIGMSRSEQEFAADRHAAEAGGTELYAGVLDKMRRLQPGVSSYTRDVFRLLRNHYVPPFVDCFAKHLDQPLPGPCGIEEEADLDRVHPPTADRIAALPPALPRQSSDSTPAFSLLNPLDLPRLQRKLATAVLPDKTAELKPITWAEAVELLQKPQTTQMD